MTLVYWLVELIFHNDFGVKGIYQGINLQLLWYPEKDAVRLYGLNEHHFDLSIRSRIKYINYGVTLLNNGVCPKWLEFEHHFDHHAMLNKGMIVNMDESMAMCEKSLPLDELFGFPRKMYGWQFSD